MNAAVMHVPIPCNKLPEYLQSIHCLDIIISTMASQITSLTILNSTVYSGADQRKHQSFASLAFVRGIHRWPVNSPHEGPVTREMLPFDDVIMIDRPKCMGYSLYTYGHTTKAPPPSYYTCCTATSIGNLLYHRQFQWLNSFSMQYSRPYWRLLLWYSGLHSEIILCSGFERNRSIPGLHLNINTISLGMEMTIMRIKRSQRRFIFIMITPVQVR